MIFVAFLVAALYLPFTAQPSVVGRWGALMVGTAWLVSRYPRFTMTRVHWAGLALLAWVLVGLLWSFSPWDTLGGLARLAALAGVFMLAYEVQDNSYALVAFGAGVAVSTVFAVLQRAGINTVYDVDVGGVSGLFLTKNAAAEAAMPVLVWALLTRRWLLASTMALAVVLSGAKEAWLMAGGAGLVAALYYARRVDPYWVVGVWIMAALMVGIACIAVYHAPATFLVSLDQRLEIWQFSLAAWWMHPWGWGLNNYPSMFMGFEYAHNDYVQLLVELGPGAILVVVVLGKGLLSAQYRIAEKAALASLLAAALVWWPLEQPASAFLIALLAGSLCGHGSRASIGGRRGRDHDGAYLHLAQLAAGDVPFVARSWRDLSARP